MKGALAWRGLPNAKGLAGTWVRRTAFPGAVAVPDGQWLTERR